MNRTIVFSFLLLLGGCGSGGAEDGTDKADPVAQVRTARAAVGETDDQTVLYGTAEPGPGGEHALVAPAEAVIAKILAPNGTTVRAGQAVAILNPSRATAVDAAKAMADAASADAAYARAKRLRGDGLASDADVDAARAVAETANAARANLGMGRSGAVLRAPVAGVVQALSARIGDQVAAGAAVASIAVKGNLRAHLGIDPAAARRVRLGQLLELSSGAAGSHAVVRVDGLDTQADSATRLASVYADIPRDFDVGPGGPLRASLSLAAQANALTIPYAALLDDGGRSYVFVVKGGVAHEQAVSPGTSSGDRIQILKGLKAGDEVVTEGGTALEDGMKVSEREAVQ